MTLEKVDGDDNLSDLFTKALDNTRFMTLRTKLGVIHRSLVGGFSPAQECVPLSQVGR